MSAPDPVKLHVWASLVTAIEGIVGGSNYHTSVRTATSDLVNILLLPPDRCPAVMVMAANGKRVFHMAGQTKDTYSFVLEARIDAEGAAVHAKMHAYTRFALDIEYALTRDVTRGGLASATFVYEPGEPFMGVGNSGTVIFQNKVDVVAVRDTGER